MIGDLDFPLDVSEPTCDEQLQGTSHEEALDWIRVLVKDAKSQVTVRL